MSYQPTRRHFIFTSAVAGAALASPKLLKANPISAAEKLNVACIGVGGRGAGDLQGVADCAGVNIVGLCDVDSKRLDEAAAKHHGAKKYTDFRKMLDEQKDIDAVTVATPDHTHFPAAMMAMAMGKHVYCEKPLTYSLEEARRMTLAARKYKVATQMGTQHHATEGVHRQAEWLRSGELGDIREVHIWTNRPIWPQGIDRPKDTPPVPANLNWDLWLSVAAERPYNPAYAPFKWRGWKDFGTGSLGDMGCHLFDATHWGLNLNSSCTVAAETFHETEETYPNWSIVEYRFPARGNLVPMRVTWYDGNKKPPQMLAPNTKLASSGTLFIGDKATMYAPLEKGGDMPEIIHPNAADFKQPAKTLARSPGHHQDWVNACRGGKAAPCNFDYAGPLTEAVLLGNLAIRTGETIQWNSAKLETDNANANQLVRREYRKGWEVA